MIRKDKAQEKSNVKKATIAGQKVQYRTDRIIVKMKESTEEEKEKGEKTASFQRACQKVCEAIPGGDIARMNERSRRVIYTVNPDTDVRKLIKDLSALDEVEYAEYDVVDEIQLTIPSDTRYSEQWAHKKIQSERAWDVVKGNSTNILIGIIDSGISISAGGALDHNDLDSGRYILGTDYVDAGTPRDQNAHGTHVVGIAASESNNCNGVVGMDWESQVYICRTLDANGNGSSSGFADALEEIVDYAVAHGMKAVINYSAGGGDNQTKRDACQYANDNGMILCAAVGNDNGGLVISPASHSVNFNAVIAVGSTDSDDSVSSFSNVGPEVTVVAPGRGILSTTPTYSVSPFVTTNYDVFDGTSMATPLVTGLVALMWSRRPTLSNIQIRNCLIQSCVKLGAGNFNNTWGFGRVDAYEAVACIVIRKFCFFPPYTLFTRFTNFTPYTLFTRFTNFTNFTPFTLFTRFTPFTPFTEFTPPIEGEIPVPGVAETLVQPFVRFRNRVYALEDIQVGKFEALGPYRQSLSALGINHLHELASTDPQELGQKWQNTEQANRAVGMAQQIMKIL